MYLRANRANPTFQNLITAVPLELVIAHQSLGWPSSFAPGDAVQPWSWTALQTIASLYMSGTQSEANTAEGTDVFGAHVRTLTSVISRRADTTPNDAATTRAMLNNSMKLNQLALEAYFDRESGTPHRMYPTTSPSPCAMTPLPL